MGIRLLFVTQERDARERIASAIREELQVLFADCATSGREALARLAARRPDVLLVGLPLRDMSGVEFVRAAKRALASCQILLVAAPGSEEVLIVAIEAGAAGCVLEPCDARELVAHALKLRLPGCQRIMLAAIQWIYVEHVAHRHADGVKLVLNAQELQGIFAIAIDEIVLQFAQTCDSAGYIKRVADDGQ